jgi:hypothetical protein
MTQSRQKEWFTDILEGVPSIAFIALWRGGYGMETAGWAGSGLAAAVLLYLSSTRTRSHPVLFGINLHILFATPVIIGLFRLGAGDLGALLADHGHRGVLVTVFLVGIGQTLFTSAGLIGSQDLPLLQKRTYSLSLLAVSLAGILWAFGIQNSGFMAVFVPLTVLFGLRRFLLARWHDRNPSGSEAVLLVAPVSDAGGHEMA